MVGQILGGRYTILEKLGEGGMAEVYKARCSVLNRIVALKILRPQFACDEEFVERFRREGRAAASLSHPNVVNIYDVGRDGDKHYIVMEYVKGATLKEIIKREGCIPPGYAAWIAREICHALEHAHRNNIVHRDVKPHNILVTQDGMVKVADFGIAHAASTNTITETGTVIGTVSYFSPEQARGGQVSPQSDIYSLGIVLYEMLCGRVPFRGDSPIAVAIQHIQEKPVPPRTLNPDVPEGLERVVMRALEKDPSKRFKTAEDMARALDPFATPPDIASIDDEAPTAIMTGEDLRRWRESLESGSTAVKRPDQVARPRRRGGLAVAVVTFFLILVSGTVFGLLKLPSILYVPETEVPDITGKNLDEARLLLPQSQLALEVADTRYDDKVEVNHIISQSPKAGTKVKINTKVRVIVSQGKEMVSVPDLVGLTVREAQLALERAGLAMGTKTEDYSPDMQAGAIIGQVPDPGQRLERGLPVDIVISKGPMPPGVQVPNVVGMNIDSAKKAIEAAGLVVGSELSKADAGRPDGEVVQQYPESGSMVQPQSSVDLVVSRPQGTTPGFATQGRDAATTPTVTWVTVTVPQGKSSQEVVIKVDDFYGEREVFRSFASPGERVEQHVVGYGDNIHVKVFIDGVLFKDEEIHPQG
ncbi:MAG: Stk1 family PASTA domain-containing Ser/Thr kinase [Firmicutes bacterium]|nr:Stk1 family PASTA domain-containing Ser/Thr kinase [Bacillota bacterium]